jgi:hypothetical protein
MDLGAPSIGYGIRAREDQKPKDNRHKLSFVHFDGDQAFWGLQNE